MKRGRPRDLVLFVDPHFWENPEGRQLTPGERDDYLRLLAEVLIAGNGGHVPSHGFGVNSKRLRRFVAVGLLDDTEGSLSVHDWNQWNGRDAYKRFLSRERKRRQRRENG